MQQSPSTNAVALVEANSTPLGVQLVSSRKTNKMAEAQDLVDLAMQVQKADEFIKANAGNRLTQIADQIRYLQDEARKVLEKAKRDAELHHAACNLVKKPGSTYYFYERESGQRYLSILSPEEWGASCPHEFIAAYRLEYDQSWTPMEEINRRDTENAVINKIFNTQLAVTDGAHSGLTKGLLEET